ncbi:ankyrin repeat domain-containing protein [Pontiella agarivorans]|uniref:Ankyrin repeat domain-containing protein n=1 Tax=Pontiella agarivorans TaxID=3038953 RepID=A0ABU5MW67_9BACT|nr:ankyrin repeat domain-containing protein [Pontiella agarivorans]MDZ8118336.1 ankyrin repeat domain-containing protein [Pontiella agarivorans]
MADLFIVRGRLRFSALLGLVLTALSGLATWHFYGQLEFELDDRKFLFSAILTGALALGTVGLFITFLAAQWFMNPSRSLTDRLDSFPWWVVGMLLVLVLIGGAGYFVAHYQSAAQSEFDLLRAGKWSELEQRVSANPRLFTRKDAAGQTMIQVAYRENYPEAFGLLANLGAPPVDLDPRGGSPVLASLGNLPMLEVLLNAGLTPSINDVDGTPAVHRAAERSDSAALKLLIKAGAGVDERNGLYRTALMQCVGNAALQQARVLLAAGADVNTFDQRGDTALHIAVRRRSVPAVELLLENGADADSFNFLHQTPLHLAAEGGQDQLVKLFADTLENIDLIDEENRTPLETALANRHYETATLLMESGADTDRILGDRKTILHHAIENREYAIARFLLRSGARADIPDSDGLTALDVCKVKELQGLVEMIEGVPDSEEDLPEEN